MAIQRPLDAPFLGEVIASQSAPWVVSTTGSAYAVFSHGAISSVGTLAVQIMTASIASRVGVVVKADDDNTAPIYVGNSSVTAGTTDSTDGFRLQAGQGVRIEVDNVNKVYVVGSSAGQKAWWVIV